MRIQFSDREENIVGKEEIACYEQFLLFPQCFQKLSFVYVFEYMWSNGLNTSRSGPYSIKCRKNSIVHLFVQFDCSKFAYKFNPLPDMSKIWTNGDTIISLSRKHCGKWRFLLFPQCFLSNEMIVPHLSIF